jgi:signal transduction histidine kinase
MSGFADRVVESFGSALLAIDARGRIALLNDEARRLLALPPGPGPLGSDCREALREEPRLVRLLLTASRGSGRLSRTELALERDGPESAIGLSLFPVRDAGGEPSGAAMLFRDLVPIERSEEQVRLQARLAALGQMAAGLAHEIRNPLASMEVLAGLLLRRIGDGQGEERELALGLLAQVRELSKIVSTSLDFVRPGVSQRASLDPVALVEGALDRALPKASAARVEVERCFVDPAPRVAVDEEGMTVALANLIANACDALGRIEVGPRRLVLGVGCEAPEVTVRDAAPPGLREVVISVGDNGPGVPAELREKIFYPFFTTRERGSGIGLATAQKVISGHGGCIELDEGNGGGAIFRVRLPVASRPGP